MKLCSRKRKVPQLIPELCWPKFLVDPKLDRQTLYSESDNEFKSAYLLKRVYNNELCQTHIMIINCDMYQRP